MDNLSALAKAVMADNSLIVAMLHDYLQHYGTGMEAGYKKPGRRNNHAGVCNHLG